MRASKRRRNCPHHIAGARRYLVGARRVAVLGRGSSLALNLDFTQGVLPASIAFSRAGHAMLTDATGNLTFAPNNQLTYSNTFSNAAWTNVTATITTGVADPFGGTTASTLTATGTNSLILRQNLGIQDGVNILGAIWVRRRTGSGTINVVRCDGGGWNPIGITSSWQQFSNIISSNGVASHTGGAGVQIVTSGDAVDVYGGTVSAVTYETTPRAGDQVVTGAAAYYGARFDRDPVTHAPLGLLVEGAATNLYLNSQAPATQNLTVTAQAYTISAYGVGTLTLSGTATGTLTGTGASTLVQMTVTPTAGTLTLTPTGTLTYVQVETGSSATSRIVTAAASASRAADVVALTPAAFARVVNVDQGTVFVDDVCNTFAGFLSPLSFNGAGFNKDGSGHSLWWNGAANIATSNTATIGSPNREAFRWTANSRAIAMNGGAVISDSNVPWPSPPTTVNIGNFSGNTQFLGGYIRRIAIYRTALASGQFQALSNIGAALR